MESSGIAMPVEVSAAELNALLRDTDKPVLVYIWAPWCPPCKTMTPDIAKAAALLKDEVTVVKLDAASESQALTAFNIATVPSLLLFSQDGRENARTLGSLNILQIVDWVRQHDRPES